MPAKIAARWRWAENFGVLEVFIVVQLLSFGVLLLPGTQPIRFFVRAAPYLMSGALLLLPSARLAKGPAGNAWQHPAAPWLLGALVVLGLNLLHPSTPLAAGVAQLIFQICIAAPLFWATRCTVNAGRLERLLWLLLFCYGLSAVIGALQVFYPDIFLPRDFSALLSEDYLGSLSYEGTAGQTIFRPPGLSDVPGGAATGGVAAALVALIFLNRPRTGWFVRLACAAVAAVGLFVLYLCQVRSFFLMLLVAILGAACLGLRRGRTADSARLLIGCAVVVGAAFVWAVSIGGEEVSERFLGLAEGGAGGMVENFQENRGGFFAATFEDYLWQYPLGAGPGRWGMMNLYFGNPDAENNLYAEVQLTGWLYDGGVPMWILYGGALLIAMGSTYAIAVRHPDEKIVRFAQIVFCLNLLVVGQTFAGPVFNNQLGILFWLLTAVLHAAARNTGNPTATTPGAQPRRVPDWIARIRVARRRLVPKVPPAIPAAGSRR